MNIHTFLGNIDRPCDAYLIKRLIICWPSMDSSNIIYILLNYDLQQMNHDREKQQQQQQHMKSTTIKLVKVIFHCFELYARRKELNEI